MKGLPAELLSQRHCIHEGESIENALRRFKRKVLQEDIMKEAKKQLLLSQASERGIATLLGPRSTLYIALNSLLTAIRGQAAMQIKVIALRHQLTVLQGPQKPK